MTLDTQVNGRCSGMMATRTEPSTSHQQLTQRLHPAKKAFRDTIIKLSAPTMASTLQKHFAPFDAFHVQRHPITNSTTWSGSTASGKQDWVKAYCCESPLLPHAILHTATGVVVGHVSVPPLVALPTIQSTANTTQPLMSLQQWADDATDAVGSNEGIGVVACSAAVGIQVAIVRVWPLQRHIANPLYTIPTNGDDDGGDRRSFAHRDMELMHLIPPFVAFDDAVQGVGQRGRLTPTVAQAIATKAASTTVDLMKKKQVSRVRQFWGGGQGELLHYYKASWQQQQHQQCSPVAVQDVLMPRKGMPALLEQNAGGIEAVLQQMMYGRLVLAPNAEQQ